jgi:hypothetical protein
MYRRLKPTVNKVFWLIVPAGLEIVVINDHLDYKKIKIRNISVEFSLNVDQPR